MRCRRSVPWCDRADLLPVLITLCPVSVSPLRLSRQPAEQQKSACLHYTARKRLCLSSLHSVGSDRIPEPRPGRGTCGRGPAQHIRWQYDQKRRGLLSAGEGKMMKKILPRFRLDCLQPARRRGHVWLAHREDGPGRVRSTSHLASCPLFFFSHSVLVPACPSMYLLVASDALVVSVSVCMSVCPFLSFRKTTTLAKFRASIICSRGPAVVAGGRLWSVGRSSLVLTPL
ncbi:hypothetical protein GGR56DRAFT_654107 [Xylariaceae sp. FL0804]|nr:hypothetical protein GGR56DRAFT_654107 [Xylariaceae sp. FL0804]